MNHINLILYKNTHLLEKLLIPEKYIEGKILVYKPFVDNFYIKKYIPIEIEDVDFYLDFNNKTKESEVSNTTISKELKERSKKTFTIIASQHIFKYCLKNYVCKNIYIISNQPDFYTSSLHNLLKFQKIEKYSNNLFIIEYSYKNLFEYKYLELCSKILEKCNIRNDRTEIGTYSLFGKRLKIDISEFFPLMTTKRVFWRGIAEELLWFLRGSTNAKELQEKDIHIWDGNSSREFLDKNGLSHLEEGDLGEVYGFQWNHFGAQYKNCHTNYGGFNQIDSVIEMIKKNPNSRRILVSSWNPTSLKNCALPPCHVLFQFYVHDGKLSCQMYQRSADIFLGVPFNIASYALLTYMIAYLTNLKPHELIIDYGDAHVYKNAVEQMQEQMTRIPYSYPKLVINVENRKINDIRDFNYDDFKLINMSDIKKGYRSHPSIKADMAI